MEYQCKWCEQPLYPNSQKVPNGCTCPGRPKDFCACLFSYYWKKENNMVSLFCNAECSLKWNEKENKK